MSIWMTVQDGSSISRHGQEANRPSARFFCSPPGDEVAPRPAAGYVIRPRHRPIGHAERWLPVADILAIGPMPPPGSRRMLRPLTVPTSRRNGSLTDGCVERTSGG